MACLREKLTQTTVTNFMT